MDNVIRFYMFNNKLKSRLRQGWLDVKISSPRIESVSEHIYGCLILALSINSEYKLNLNMEKILKMLIIHELEEIIIPDYSALATISREEKREMGKKAVKKVLDGLVCQDEMMNLTDEFNARLTKEAKFCHHIDKIEADFQAKIYDLGGYFDLEAEKNDCRAWYGSKAEEVIAASKSASDIWLTCDHYIYEDDELFSKLQHAIRDIKQTDYETLVNDEDLE